jgi:hypothetical protein
MFKCCLSQLKPTKKNVDKIIYVSMTMRKVCLVKTSSIELHESHVFQRREKMSVADPTSGEVKKNRRHQFIYYIIKNLKNSDIKTILLLQFLYLIVDHRFSSHRLTRTLSNKKNILFCNSGFLHL